MLRTNWLPVARNVAIRRQCSHELQDWKAGLEELSSRNRNRKAQPVDCNQDGLKQPPGHSHLRELEGDPPGVANDFRPDLDQFLPSRRQGPAPDLPRELPPAAGPPAGSQALDLDDDSGEIDQDRGESRSPRPAGHLPTRGGGCAPEVVSGHLDCNRPVAPSDSGSWMKAPPTQPSSLGVHGSIVSLWRRFVPPAANLCGAYITAAPQHAAKATSRSKTKPVSACFIRTSPQSAQIMNSNGKSRFTRIMNPNGKSRTNPSSVGGAHVFRDCLGTGHK